MITIRKLYHATQKIPLLKTVTKKLAYSYSKLTFRSGIDLSTRIHVVEEHEVRIAFLEHQMTILLSEIDKNRTNEG